MNPLEPGGRRRGSFLPADPPDDPDGDAAEGFTVRVRIIRPLRKRAPVTSHRVGPHRTVHGVGGIGSQPDSTAPAHARRKAPHTPPGRA